MKILGGFLRHILNINTVWGLMILVSFLLCVSQQYLPTTTVIAADRLRPGANTVTIHVAGPNKETRSYEYPISLAPDGLRIPPEEQTPRKDRPWLISARAVAGGFLLKWDDDGYGKYELAVNGAVVGRGRLVTLQTLTDAAFDYAQKGFEIALGLVAAMVLFLGLMKVGEDAGIVQLVAKAFHPILRILLPGVPRDHPANGAVLMNITTGILGLGNAATPFGLKAMKELDSLNPHPGIATDAQVALLAWNTGGLALLPATLLAVRKSAGCSDPFEIIGTCLIAGAVSSVMAVIVARLLAKLPFFSVRAALAEETSHPEPPAADRAPALADAKEEK
jgi:spore maturation protein A